MKTLTPLDKALLAVAAMALAGLAVMHLWPQDPPPAKPTAPAAAIAKEAPAEVPITTPTVRAAATRPATKKALGLPKEIQAAPEQVVLAATDLKPDYHLHTLTTTMNTETGEVQTFDQVHPLPWLARDHGGRLDLAIGYRDMEPVARLSLTQSLLQIKRVRIGLVGSVTQELNGNRDRDWLVGINAGVSW